MTAQRGDFDSPAPLSGGDARTQLAEVLDERLPDSMGRAECNALLDALLPVVRQIAAAELRAAADALTDRARTWVLNELRDRADHLDGQAT